MKRIIINKNTKGIIYDNEDGYYYLYCKYPFGNDTVNFEKEILHCLSNDVQIEIPFKCKEIRLSSLKFMDKMKVDKIIVNSGLTGRELKCSNISAGFIKCNKLEANDIALKRNGSIEANTLNAKTLNFITPIGYFDSITDMGSPSIIENIYSENFSFNAFRLKADFLKADLLNFKILNNGDYECKVDILQVKKIQTHILEGGSLTIKGDSEIDTLRANVLNIKGSRLKINENLEVIGELYSEDCSKLFLKNEEIVKYAFLNTGEYGVFFYNDLIKIKDLFIRSGDKSIHIRLKDLPWWDKWKNIISIISSNIPNLK